MWNPIDEPTNIPELQDIHDKLRLRYSSPSLELYNEYWAILMGQTFYFGIQTRYIGGKEFVQRMRTWHMHSYPIRGLEQKIKKELFVLHAVYKDTIVPYEQVDALLTSVEQFVRNAPTYLRSMRTVLGYPTFKYMYGCCGLYLSSIPAIGFETCLCRTHANLCRQVESLRHTIQTKELLPHIDNIQGLLTMWSNQEKEARSRFTHTVVS